MHCIGALYCVGGHMLPRMASATRLEFPLPGPFAWKEVAARREWRGVAISSLDSGTEGMAENRTTGDSGDRNKHINSPVRK